MVAYERRPRVRGSYPRFLRVDRVRADDLGPTFGPSAAAHCDIAIGTLARHR